MSSLELVNGYPAIEKINLERLVGIRERRVCAAGEDSLTLAVAAARDCLAHSSYDADDLDVVICTSITRSEGRRTHRFEPTFAATIARHLGAERAATFDLSNACAGMCTGVAILNAMIAAGSIRRGIVVSGENITPLAENARRAMTGVEDAQLASLTLGDAGAAAVIDRADEDELGIEASEFTTLAQYSDLCVGKPSRVGPGGAMFTDAASIHRVSVENAPQVIERTLERAALRYRDIDFVVPHQTSTRAVRYGRRIVDAVFHQEEPGPVYLENLADYGNTSSTTHFHAVYRFLEEGLFEPHHWIFLVAQASGLVVGGLIFQVGRLCQRYGHNA